MEQDNSDLNVDPDSEASGSAISPTEPAGGATQAATEAQQSTVISPPPYKWLESTVLTTQDLLDLPKQILPDETYRHLQNAATEAFLALATLAQAVGTALNDVRRGSNGEKIRRHIDVE